jgi:hypothetical protein
MTQALPIQRLIKTTVNLTPAAAQMQNISTLLILGSSDVIDTTERFRNYISIDGVAADFGTTAPEYLSAVLWFEQTPQPSTLQIGRWANAATAGKLIGATLSAAQQAIAVWTAVTAGAFKIAIDGGAAANVTGMNFSAQTNLNGVASVIQTALVAAHAGMTVIWNDPYDRFEIKSGTTGSTSAVSFLTAPGTGTDISGMLAMLATSSGAYVSNGIVAETALAATTLFDQNYGQNWYGLTIIGAADSDHLSVAAYIEAATNKHIYGISTTEAGVISSTSTTDIAYTISQLKYKRSGVQYSSSNLYSVSSLFGRIMTTDYEANNSVITLMWKQEPGIVAETLNVSQITALEGKNANVFVAYNNNTAIIEKGTMASGDFIDIITGTDWLSLDVQTQVFNLMYTSPTKIPQTDAGNQTIITMIESVLSQAVRNGLLAPGIWQSAGFGALSQGDFLAKGFYVYAPPIAQQNASDRAARKSVTFQVAAKLAGAIHTVDILINVNR